MATYSLSVRPPPLLLLPAPEQISTRLLAEQQAPGVTTFLLGTCPDEVRRALRTFKPNDAVTSTFRLGNAIPNACARMWLCLCARDLTYVKMRALRDPVSYISCVHCALGQAGWRPKGEQWNGQRNRPLLIKNKMHILP